MKQNYTYRSKKSIEQEEFNRIWDFHLECNRQEIKELMKKNDKMYAEKMRKEWMENLLVYPH